MAENSKNHVSFSITNGSIVRVIVFGLLLVALYYLRGMLLVILTAIVIASFIDAAARRFSRWGVNRTLSVVIIYIVGLAFLAGVFYLFVPILVVETSNLISLLSKYLPASDLLQNLQTQQQALGASDLANSFTRDGGSISSLVTNARLFVSNLSTGFFDALSHIFGGILNVIIIIVVSFYLSIQERGVEAFLRIITPLKSETYVLDLWQRTQRKIALWIKGQLILGLIIGVLIYLGLSILGVQYALVLAIAAAILELIPFGILLATVPAVSFAYIDGGITLALLVAGLYIIIQQFESYLIQPLVIKKVIGISPLVVILSVLIGAELAGFWGLILGIPVAVALLEFSDDVEKHKILSRKE